MSDLRLAAWNIFIEKIAELLSLTLTTQETDRILHHVKTLSQQQQEQLEQLHQRIKSKTDQHHLQIETERPLKVHSHGTL